MEQPIIEVKDLLVVFNGETVLDKVSFNVYKGEVFIVLGGSGCGKSTLLKHMIGLLDPAGGEVLIEGDDIIQSDEISKIKILNKIGVMYQQGALFSSMSLIENISLPLFEFTDLPEEAIDMIARMKLKLVGLEKFCDYNPSEISGGMKKRAAIARAMALDPKILFLDEPSAGLDPVTSAELDSLILRLSKTLGITFVIVTHELESIYAIASRVIMLDKRVKKIIATGDPKVLKETATDPWIRNFFRREVSSSEG